jgi:outer membrane protein assembly factor BamC
MTATKGLFVKSTFPLALLAAAISLSGCSILEGNKVDYKSTARPVALEVPPDLSQLKTESRYTVLNGAVSALQAKSAATAGQPEAKAMASIAPLEIADARIERMGDKRWIVIKRTPEALWQPIKGFWQESGFPLATEQSEIGIMETEWVENRAKIPQDFLRSAISKVFDNLYSSPEQYKFRTRLERNINGETEIFVSQRSRVETYTSDLKDRTVWQSGPVDPEVEAEFINKLLRKLGAVSNQSAGSTGSSALQPKVTLSATSSALDLSEGFDSAWRRVGLTLDRSGFTVEDRDRSKGLYFVRYAHKAPDAEAGFMQKIMSFKWGSDSKDVSALKYQIEVKSAGTQSTVKVLDSKGQADTTDAGRAILKLLANDLK